MLITCDPWQADGRPGRVSDTFVVQEEFILGICSWKDANIQYIIEGLLFDAISKQTGAEKSSNLDVASRRDLLYETDSGTETQSVKVIV